MSLAGGSSPVNRFVASALPLRHRACSLADPHPLGTLPVCADPSVFAMSKTALTRIVGGGWTSIHRRASVLPVGGLLVGQADLEH
jgi:hypothetical protein